MPSEYEVRCSCRACNHAWRREAACLRQLAEGKHLLPHQRRWLLNEAGTADRQADWWHEGAVRKTRV
jgi:hypothetical protein